MAEVHRLDVEQNRVFFAPKFCTFGFQPSRGNCSIWFNSDDVVNTRYLVTITGYEVAEDFTIRQTVVLPDGYTVMHLLELN